MAWEKAIAGFNPYDVKGSSHGGPISFNTWTGYQALFFKNQSYSATNHYYNNEGCVFLTDPPLPHTPQETPYESIVSSNTDEWRKLATFKYDLSWLMDLIDSGEYRLDTTLLPYVGFNHYHSASESDKLGSLKIGSTTIQLGAETAPTPYSRDLSWADIQKEITAGITAPDVEASAQMQSTAVVFWKFVYCAPCGQIPGAPCPPFGGTYPKSPPSICYGCSYGSQNFYKNTDSIYSSYSSYLSRPQLYIPVEVRTAPEVETLPALNIGRSSARLMGYIHREINRLHDPPYCYAGFQYWCDPDLVWERYVYAGNVSGYGVGGLPPAGAARLTSPVPIGLAVNGLLENRSWSFRAFIYYDGEFYFGDTLNFKTLPGPEMIFATGNEYRTAKQAADQVAALSVGRYYIDQEGILQYESRLRRSA